MHEYQARINRVIEYIDVNYTLPLTLKELADVAFFSEFHFQRIFTSLMGESPNRYLKRIKIEKSISDLLYSNRAITEIALQYGFSSSANFSKTFKNYYHTSPRRCRRLGEKEFRKLVNNKPLSIEDITDFEVTIEEIDEINVAYSTSWGNYYLGIPLAWARLYSWAGRKKLINENVVLGVTYDNPNICLTDKLRYEACISVPKGIEPKGSIGVKTLQGGCCATILFCGKYSELPALFNGFYRNWLPKSGFEPDDRPGFQIHTSKKNKRVHSGASLKICIPLRKS